MGYRKLAAVLALATTVWAVVPRAAATGDANLVTPTPRAVADPAGDLAEMQARFDEAVRVVEEAEAQLRASAVAEEEAKAEIERLDTELTRLAIDEYVDGGAIRSGAAEVSADPHTAVQRRTLVDVVAGDRIAILEDLRSAKDRLVQARPEVEASLETARGHRGEMDRQLKELKAAQERKAKQDLEAALAAQRDARRPKPPASGSAPLPTGGGQVSVRGIVVHQSIASNLDAMLGAADAAGVRLSGSGYRDPAAQRRLRQANCPDPVNSPASSCSPPTAKPGQSMHERGLAIDFTYNGALITSRSNTGFRWLAANAPRFGFANLPSEPWHWSPNGN